MSVVKRHSGGAHHNSADQCSGAERNTSSTQLEPEPSTSLADMGGEQKFSRSSREMRNMAEKMRRDRLNGCINELAAIVPLCSGSSKRLDKTSTLRLAANYICMHKLLMGEEDGAKRVPSVLGGNVAHNLAEAVGGFLLVVTSTGKVIYVTEAVEQFLGHSQVDLLGHSIYNVIHPDDHEIFQQNLSPKGTSRVSFFCRMMEKALTRNDPGRYEIIHVVGQIKPIPASANIVPASPTTAALSPGARSSSDTEGNYESDEEAENQTPKASVNRIGSHILISFVRVVKDRPITELSLVESTLDEYITRHGLTGSILYTDHRISVVTGMMPGDVIGKSAFSYMHPDDRVWSIVAQKLMFTSTQGQGIVSYRLRCGDGSHVTLRSRGYLEVDKQTGQVESFICINTVVSVNEADDEIKNQRRKLLPIISSEDCEDYLKTISNSLPPELLKDVMPLLTPKALQSLASSFRMSELTEAKVTELDTTMQPKQKCGVSIDVLNNPEERRSEPSPYQSKPKKLCSSERYYSSPEQCTIKTPETEESMREAASNQWYSSHKKASMDDFKTVVTKNFSFEREQFKQTQVQNDQQLRPDASPQAQVCSAFHSQYGNKNCHQPSTNQYNIISCTDQNITKDRDINICQQNISFTVPPAAGGPSPLGNGDEFIPDVADFPVNSNIILVENQNNDFSSKIKDQMNVSPGFSGPKYSPALKEDVNTRILSKPREAQTINRDMTSPGGSLMNRSETNMSPGGTYPFHTVSADVLLTESTEDSGVSSYASPQEWRDNSSITSAILSSPAVSPGCQNFQQVECDGSTNSKNQSGAAHQSHNILSQYSTNSAFGIRDPYHYPQYQQQQQLLLQQQQQHHHQQQQQALQHYPHQSAISAAKHSLTVSSPKLVAEMQGQLRNQIPESNGPVTNWQSGGGDIPCHSAVIAKSPEMYCSSTLTPMESDSGQALQCDASLDQNTANLCSRNRSSPDQPEACYSHCAASPQEIVQSHLSTKYIATNKTYNPLFQCSPSQNEVEGKFL